MQIPGVLGDFRVCAHLITIIYESYDIEGDPVWVQNTDEYVLPGGDYTTTMPSAVMGGDAVATQVYQNWLASLPDYSADIVNVSYSTGQALDSRSTVAEVSPGWYRYTTIIHRYVMYYSSSVVLSDDDAALLFGGLLLIVLLVLLLALASSGVGSVGASLYLQSLRRRRLYEK